MKKFRNIVLLILMALYLGAFVGCDVGGGKKPTDEFVKYSLNGFVVKRGTFGDAFIDPNNLEGIKDSDKQLYNSVMDMYGRSVEINSTQIKFSGSVLGLYNPVSYTQDSENIKVGETNLRDTFNTFKISKGKITFGVMNNGIGFVFEYCTPDYIAEPVITFDYQGATAGNTVTSKQIVTNQQIGELPMPTKIGYEFLGWFDNSTAGKLYTAQDTYNKSTNIKLYAHWQIVNYTITYEMNGGLNNPQNQTTYNINTFMMLYLPNLRDGYNFGGWFENSDFSGEQVTVISGRTGDVTLYAKWIEESYIIEYDLNGGENNSDNPTKYNTGLIVSLLPATRDGYKFWGWFDNIWLTGNEVVSTESLDGNLTLYAKWQPSKYNINYELNGAISNNDKNPNYYETGIDKRLYPLSDINGYAFGGWYYESDFSGSAVTVIGGSTKDITLHAKWNIVDYTIRYELNGGTNNPDNPNGYSIDSGTIILKDATGKRGYTFAGWRINSYNESIYEIAAGSTGNKHLYAQWTPIIYNINYDINGGILLESGSPITYTIANTTILKGATRNGYTFDGWLNSSGDKVGSINQGSIGDINLTASWNTVLYHINYELNGGKADNETYYDVETEDITLQDAVKKGYRFDGWFDSYDRKTTIISIGSYGDIALSAKWTVIPYNITYNSNGGILDYGYEKTYTVEDNITLKGATRVGYTFGGWFTTDTFTPDGKFTQIAKGSTENIILYAKWNVVDYTITYNLNNGTNDEHNPIEYNIESNAIKLAAPVRSGYIFGGWYETSDFSGVATKVIAAQSIGNIELYAKFTAMEFTVTFNTVGGVVDPISTKVTFGKPFKLPVPTKDYYTFNGWYQIFNDGIIGDINRRITDENGDSINNWYMYTDMEFNATWKPVAYDISYVLNGGINAKNPVTYDVKSAIEFEKPTYVGYTFNGWYTDSNFSGNSISQIEIGSHGDLTLHAKFTANDYIITFDYKNSDGNIGAANKTVTYGSETGELPSPTKSPYTFGGWFRAENGGGEQYLATDIYSLADNITLYPYWQGTLGLSYTLNTNKTAYMVSGETDNSANIIIAPYYKGLPVTMVIANGFINKINITSIHFPSTILAIGDRAFNGCKNLTSVVVPSSVQSIGSAAFMGCKLTDITLPFIGKTIATSSNLRETVLGHIFGYSDNSSSNGIKQLFNTEFYNSYFDIPKTLRTVTVTGTQNVPNNAFYGCTMLSEININSGVTEIGAYAFGSTSITSFSLPTAIITINAYVFNSCAELLNIDNIGSITGVGEYAFADSAVENLSFTKGLKSVGRYAFSNCKLTSINLSSELVSIGDRAFNGCKNLTSVVVPSSVQSIGSAAFMGCKLTDITLPFIGKTIATSSNLRETVLGHIFGYSDNSSSNGIKQLFNTEFYNSYFDIPKTLRTVTVTGTQNVPNNAFYGCTMLSEININNSIKTIGSYAFGSTGIGTFTVDENVTKIGENAFSDCLYLTNLFIKSSKAVVSAGANVLINTPTNLKIIVADSLLGEYQVATNWSNYISYFVGSSFVSGDYIYKKTGTTIIIVKYLGREQVVTIPSQIDGKTVEIGEYAFAYNNYITQVSLPNTLTVIPNSAFRGCRKLAFISIPDSIKSIGNNSFNNCQSLEYVTFNGTVELDRIGNSAFASCLALTQINYTDLTISAMGNYVFSGCKALVTVDLSRAKIGTIDEFLFSGCAALKNVKLPMVTSIGIGAFVDCNIINNITIPFVDSAKHLKFYFNIREATSSYSIPSSLQFVTVQEGVTAIPYNAFCGCSNVVQITLPKTVTSVGDTSFYNCANLQMVKILNTDKVVAFNSNAFAGTHPNLTIYVANNLIDAYKVAEGWKGLKIDDIVNAIV